MNGQHRWLYDLQWGLAIVPFSARFLVHSASGCSYEKWSYWISLRLPFSSAESSCFLSFECNARSCWRHNRERKNDCFDMAARLDCTEEKLDSRNTPLSDHVQYFSVPVKGVYVRGPYFKALGWASSAKVSVVLSTKLVVETMETATVLYL